jgi:hypothetical protein
MGCVGGGGRGREVVLAACMHACVCVRTCVCVWMSAQSLVYTCVPVCACVRVRVCGCLLPPDQGTRDDGIPDEQAMAQLQKDTNGDGFNGDTMGVIPESFYAASVAIGHPIAMEPEGGGDEASLVWDTLRWGAAFAVFACGIVNVSAVVGLGGWRWEPLVLCVWSVRDAWAFVWPGMRVLCLCACALLCACMRACVLMCTCACVCAFRSLVSWVCSWGEGNGWPNWGSQWNFIPAVDKLKYLVTKHVTIICDRQGAAFRPPPFFPPPLFN